MANPTYWNNPRHNWRCLFYDGVRPCEIAPSCEGCSKTTVPKHHILIILLGRLGDVVIATGLLSSLHNKYPDSRITWITDQSAMPLLEDHPFLHRVLPPSPDVLYQLDHEHFDVIINLDRWPLPSTLATNIPADQRMGFGISIHGNIIPLNQGTEGLFEINRYPQKRSANQRSWIDLYHELAEIYIPEPFPLPVLGLKQEDITAAQKIRASMVSNDTKLVMFSPGSHRKDKQKRLSASRVAGFLDRLARQKIIRPGIIAGPDEVDLYSEIIKTCREQIFTPGVQDNLHSLIQLVLASDAIVTTDSLVLHLAQAFAKPTVALFGPTSPSIIPDRSFLSKLRAKIDCLPCYSRICTMTGSHLNPPCIEDISEDEMDKALRKVLAF